MNFDSIFNRFKSNLGNEAHFLGKSRAVLVREKAKIKLVLSLAVLYGAHEVIAGRARREGYQDGYSNGLDHGFDRGYEYGSKESCSTDFW